MAIAAGPDGNLWFTDQGTTKAIGRITPAGAITEFSSGLNAGSDPLHRRRAGREPVVHRPGRDPGHRADHARPAAITEFTSGLNAGEPPAGHRRRRGREPVVHRHGHHQGHRADHPGRGDQRVLERPERREHPAGIAPGADGNLWFTDPGTTKAVGTIGAGAPAASVSAPAGRGRGAGGLAADLRR